MLLSLLVGFWFLQCHVCYGLSLCRVQVPYGMRGEKKEVRYWACRYVGLETAEVHRDPSILINMGLMNAGSVLETVLQAVTH